MNKDIVSTNEEDKPLIFISEEAINLKRDNDNYKKEIERLNNIINELEKWINKNEKEDMEICFLHYEIWKKVSNKIKELKGDEE